MRETFKKDYYRMTGTKFSFFKFLFSYITEHRVRFVYTYRKLQCINKRRYLSKLAMFIYHRHLKTKYGLEINPDVKIGVGMLSKSMVFGMNKISIIIPCYNVEKYLPKCLDSVVNQTYKNLEIICVNDGSNDGTLKIIEKYKKKDDRIVLINQTNIGVSQARNNALKYVTGNYVMFIDSDDWIDLYTCEIALNKALSNDYDLVIWNYIREFPNNPMPKQIFSDEEIVFFENDVKRKLQRRTLGLFREELAHPENADSIVTIWGKLYKSSIVIDNKLEFTDLKKIGTSEDALFNLEVYKYIKSAIYIPNCLYHYRKDNEKSVTSNYKSEMFLQWNNLFEIMNDYILSNDLDNEYHEALDNRVSLAIIGLGLNIMSAGRNVNKINEIKNIISSPQYRRAYKQLTLRHFPLHWKIFFAFAKCNCALGLYIMLLAMRMLIGK